MGTISDKTTYLNTTKTLIREKINDLGQNLDTEDTFRSYVEALEQVYEDYPKTTTTNVTEPSINNTKAGKMEIDLKGNTEQFTTTGKNLFDKNNINLIEGYVSQGGVVTYQPGVGDKTIYIPCKANTTYTIQKMISMRFRVGCCDVTPVNNTTLNPFSGNQQTKTSYTLTSGASSQYIVLWCVDKDEPNIQQQIFDSIQIEEGSTATPYEPYTGGTASPNPDYPQDVEVVSGENKVKVVNKNLFDTELEQNARSNADGTTKIWSANYVRTIDKIKVKPNTTYRISFTLESSNGGDIQEYQKDGTYINNILLSQNGASFTTPENCYYINVQWYRSIGITPSDVTNIQLEEGSTATTYEEHKEQDFPISLQSKNLCNLSVLNQVPSINNGQMVNYLGASSSDFIEINNTKNYILSFSYTGGQANTYVFYYNNNKTFLGFYIGTQSGYALNSYSSYSSAKYVKVRTDSNSTLDFIQLEEGSTATEYQPYYNYELCKIGDYQDYIYKNNGSWYLHKEIEKVVFDGSNDESWAISATNTSGYNRFTSASIYNLIKKPTDSSQITDICSNYFIKKSADNTYGRIEGISVGTNGNLYIYADISKEYTLEQFKTWLSTHNTDLYYVLSTEQDIEITDTTLISQLNALEKAKSYDNVTNIIQENNDLPFILDIKALKKS